MEATEFLAGTLGGSFFVLAGTHTDPGLELSLSATFFEDESSGADLTLFDFSLLLSLVLEFSEFTDLSAIFFIVKISL